MFVAWAIILTAIGLSTKYFLPWKIGVIALILAGSYIGHFNGVIEY